MQPEQIALLMTEIDILSLKACREMKPAERNRFFKYQEDRISSEEGLKKKYASPVRTYYKGAKKGQTKTVYEVDGLIFEKLWKHLVMYATKASMYSHKSNNFQDFEVQNDVADIKYQSFFVLRFWGPKPSGQKFSIFFKLIVNNILTTSARRRGVYKEEGDFTNWLDTNNYDERFWDAYQDKIEGMKRPPMFIDFMYDQFLDLFFKKDKQAILKARKAHDKLKDGTVFVWSNKNCARTMTNHKAKSIFAPISKNSGSGEESVLLDVLSDDSTGVLQDFDIDLEHLQMPEHLKKQESKLRASIRMILDGESLTAAAKSINMQPSRLRQNLMQVVGSS